MEAALPREYYVDPETFSREREMLRGQWTCIGRLDELGLTDVGRAAVIDYYGESIIVTNDGNLHAHANVCRHRGSQLLPADTSPCELKALRCPYHSWTYGLDGSLLHAPHTGRLFLDAAGGCAMGRLALARRNPKGATTSATR